MANQNYKKDKLEDIKKAQLARIKSLGISLNFDTDTNNKDLLKNFITCMNGGLDWELFPSYTDRSEKKDLHIDFSDKDDFRILRLLFEDKQFFVNWVHCVKLYIHANKDNISGERLYHLRCKKVVQSFVGLFLGCQASLCDKGVDIENCDTEYFSIFKVLYEELSRFQCNRDDTNYTKTFDLFDSFKEKFRIKKCENKNLVNGANSKFDEQLNASLKKESSNTLLGKIKYMFSNILCWIVRYFVKFCTFIGIKKKEGEKDINVVHDIELSSSISNTVIPQDYNVSNAK